MTDKHVLLLTGTPGCGKTTAIRAVADKLKGKRLAGFYTAEIRSRGQREGFRLISFDHLQKTIAHVDFPGDHRVGKYGVDVAAIDEAAEQVLHLAAAVDVYLVDEIGKMECLSPRFVSAVRSLLDAGAVVVATVGKKGGGFMDEVKQRSDTELWELTRNNRDAMPERVLAWLDERLLPLHERNLKD